MSIKKIAALVLCMAMALSLVACGSAPASSAVDSASSATTEAASSEAAAPEVADSFVLEYPAHMQEAGYTEALKLDKMPERVVCLTTYPVMTLYYMGVPMMAVPSSTVIEYPEDMNAEILPSMSSDNFSIENIVEMEPDLVILPSSKQSDYGATLEGVGVPVYYVAIGAQQNNIYDVIREQSQALVDGFSMSEELAAKGADVMAMFDELDANVDELKTVSEGKTVLCLLAGGTNDLYIQTERATLGCMAEKCGLVNVYENGDAGSMVPMDMETAIDYDPDVVLITGMGEAEDVETLMKGVIELNPEYWNSIPAIAEGRVIYLSGSYVSTAGINIINNIQDLATMLGEQFQA